jgi:DNA-binding NtrC family response regulator
MHIELMNQVQTATHIHVMSGEAQLGSILNVLLQDRGFVTTGSQSVFAGFDALEADRTDILILDESLPGTLGTEALQKAMIQHPDVPVIFLTEHPQSNTAIEAILLGAYAVIAKPVQIKQLAMILVGAKARKEQHRPAAISDLAAEPNAR